MIELAEFVAPIVGRLPLDPEEDDLLFLPDTLPELPAELQTTALTALASYGNTHRGNAHLDTVGIGGERAGLRDLGLLIIAAVLQARDVTLHLAGPERDDFGRSRVHRLRITGALPALADTLGLSIQARAYCYVPTPQRSYWPFHDRRPDDCDLPLVEWMADRVHAPDERYVIQAADEFEGFGGPAGSCLLAELLLDIGHPDNRDVLWKLESFPGLPGVAAGSAELQLMVTAEPFDWIDGAHRR